MTLAEALAQLERRSSKRYAAGLARYAIATTDPVLGVPVGGIRAVGKLAGPDHALATALWKKGWYESRMLAACVAEPERVTVAQMNAWARAFDNWAVCDTACFHLWDRTPLAWGRVRVWAAAPREYVKRAAFALI